MSNTTSRAAAVASIKSKATGKAKAADADERPRDPFGQVILAEVTPQMRVLEAREFDRDRGFWLAICDTHNGFQWNTGHAMDRTTARALRDALTALLDGDL